MAIRRVGGKRAGHELAVLRDKLRGFDGREVRIGIQENQQYEDGTPVAYVGAIHEYGAPERGIPQRSFLRSTEAEKQQEWAGHMEDGVKAVIAGAVTPEQVLEMVGMSAARDVIQTISTIQEPPLSPITVMLRGMQSHDSSLKVTGKTVGEAARRVKDGLTNYGASTKPLVTQGSGGGLLKASITSKVADKE